MKWDENYANIYRQNGRAIAQIKAQAVEFAKTHWNLADIDHYVDQLIRQAGGEPAFKRVPGYHWATCINVNDGIVHGVPKGTLKPGDLVNIDTGMYYQGTTTDTSTTFVIGDKTPEQRKFLNVGQDTLYKTINKAKPGRRVWDIAETIQKNIEAAGYSVTRTLTGHGVGETMHEDPPLPCFVSNDPILKTKLQAGMVLAVEVMYMAGDWPLVTDSDGWTMRTKDGSLSAVFEENVLITPKGPEVLTAIRQ
jgi:methionyl aminopeptidase